MTFVKKYAIIKRPSSKKMKKPYRTFGFAVRRLAEILFGKKEGENRSVWVFAVGLVMLPIEGIH